MAYAAVTSLHHTIDLLLTSSRISVASTTETTLKVARWGAAMLQQNIKRYDDIKNSSEGVLAVDARIRDEARRIEDLIESEASAQFLSQSHLRHGRFSLNLHHLSRDVDRFVQTAKKMSDEYLGELYKKPSPPPAAAVAVHVDVSSTSGNDCDDDLVGVSDLFLEIRRRLLDGTLPRQRYIDGDRSVLAITGMAGIGKTTLVKKLFHDSLVKEKFQRRAFVRVGQKYEVEDISRAIIAQLNVGSSGWFGKRNENLGLYLMRNMGGGRKFLIVLDDVWDDKLEAYIRRHLTGNNGLVLLTSRIDASIVYRHSYRMQLLNEEESWELLRRKVFGEGGDYYHCPPQLVKAGKKIAENCEGLPLLILTVAQLLIKAPKNLDYWEEVAKMRNSVFGDAMDQIYEVLLPSYYYLAQNSKACFLYMCVFPKDYVVWRSKVCNLWLAEGFADGSVSYILDEIVSSNLVVTRKQDWSLTKAKACNLHVVFRHLCRREAENNKFIFILNTYADGSMEGVRDKPHLAVYHNTLLAIKAVHNSIASVSNLRSVLCTGPYHQYEVPIISLELKLLRVLDAVTIRFYEFPIEVVKLIKLRYLSLTTNANLPPSIHKLWFLEYLIVHQHMRLINLRRRRRNVADESSFVPVEIWELEQLKHLQIVGRNLPHPPTGATLSNLTKLLDVGVQSCAPGVLERIPKLEKLRIQIELGPHPAAAQTMSCFDRIFGLEYLKSLGSVVVNPKLSPEPTLQPRLRLSDFIEGLRRLSLSGFGYPWQDMAQIAKLPHLQVLKLHCYAFRGEKWEMRSKLLVEHLLIEDTDLVQWTAYNETFPNLSHLTMRNCHKLRSFPLMKALKKIELVDCNPLAETCAKRNVGCDVRVKYSWK